MTKYIQDAIIKLRELYLGMNENPNDWTNQPVTILQVEDAIKALAKKDEEIDIAKDALQIKRNEGRATTNDSLKLANQVDNLVLGIYANNPIKIVEYGLKERKPAHPKPVPGKGVISNITDDADGEGFVLERQTLETADNYEWQKAQGTDPAVTNIDESKFTYFKTTKKVKFVDDDVKTGVRYFYRTRGFNPTGNGAWSEPVSRVQ